MMENAFVDLRRLLEWFEGHPRRLPVHIARVTERLGARCIPLLTRELCGETEIRRDAARAALGTLAAAPDTRGRVIRALRSIASSNATDRGKLAALGLLSELGDRTAARFSDPAAVQRSSATAFAEALNTPVDIATAADLIVRQLSSEAVGAFLSVMMQTTPDRAAQLARELCCRHDVAPALRDRIIDIVPLGAVAIPHPRLQPRTSRVTVLVRDEPRDDERPVAACRIVVIATRKITGHRRWRRWAVLIGGLGHIDDCIHDEAEKDAHAADLIERLVSDGFKVISTELSQARSIVVDAARRTLACKTRSAALPSPYYIGRDLLDLGDTHLTRSAIHPISATLGRAVERIAADDVPTARELLACCDPTDPNVAAANATCLLMEGQCAAAVAQLRQAIAAEPMWPLHHWNMSVALYQLNDFPSCQRALQRFLATSAVPSGLYADPEQVTRVARAMQLIAVLERRSQLAAEINRPPPASMTAALQASTNKTA